MSRPPLNLGVAEKTTLALLAGAGIALILPPNFHHPLRYARHLLPIRPQRP